jgi:heme-degrading monooxygenase HmoA
LEPPNKSCAKTTRQKSPFTDLASTANRAGSYVILSEWANRAAFDAFVASEAFKNVTTWGKEQILAGRPSHTYYEH